MVQDSTINSLRIIPREKKQVVEISNSTIESLIIEDPRFSLKISSLNDTLHFTSRDGSLIVRFKNVTISHISTLELGNIAP